MAVIKKTAPKSSRASATRKDAKPSRKAKRAVKIIDDVDPIRHEMSRTELFEHLADVASDNKTEIQAKHVARIFRELLPVATAHLLNKKIARFKVPGLITIQRKDVAARRMPAQKGGQEKKNPFTGETFITEAKAAYTKPATVRVKGRIASIVKRTLIESL